MHLLSRYASFLWPLEPCWCFPVVYINQPFKIGITCLKSHTILLGCPLLLIIIICKTNAILFVHQKKMCLPGQAEFCDPDWIWRLFMPITLRCLDLCCCSAIIFFCVLPIMKLLEVSLHLCCKKAM